MKLYLDQLIIESTRRCQLSCEHCCRGHFESLDMSMETMLRFFHAADVTGIHSLTISGGEPSLRPDFICNLVKLFKKKKISVDNFYIATNAVNITEKFISAVIQLWCYCDDNEISALHWSNDVYHDANCQNVKMLEALRFAGPRYSSEESKNYYGGDSLLAEGYAENNGNRLVVPTRLGLTMFDDIMTIEEAELYVNCEGMVIRGCDFSYENQRDPVNQFCRVGDFTHEFIMNEYQKELKNG